MGHRNLVRHHGKRDLYSAVPMGIARNGELSTATRSVALYVWSHSADWQQSAANIAEELGLGRNTVAAALTELQEHRWMVREVHHKIGPKGKAVWDWERWHLQVSNHPFTVEQVAALSVPCSEREQTPAPNGSRLPALNQSTIGVEPGLDLPEVDPREVEGEPAPNESRLGTDDPWSSSTSWPKSATPPTQDLRSSIFDPRAATDVVAATPSSLTTSVSSSGGPRWGEDPFASEWDTNNDLDHCSSTSDLDPGASAGADAGATVTDGDPDDGSRSAIDLPTPRLADDERQLVSGGFRRRFSDSMSLGDEPPWN
jgi:hypothetical protein